MKHFYLLLICILCGSSNLSAQKVVTKAGVITFEASVASFEEVKATNSNVSAIFNTKTGEFASLALINGFRFKVALMEEHFNENYMESSLYPKTIVKGIVQNFDSTILNQQFTEYMLKGTIEMHGKTNQILVPVRIKKVDDAVVLATNFELIPTDFNIEIPSVVASKIAQKVAVTATYNLKVQ